MASSFADSNQVGGTKRFRYAVHNNGDRAMSKFVGCTVTALASDLNFSDYGS